MIECLLTNILIEPKSREIRPKQDGSGKMKIELFGKKKGMANILNLLPAIAMSIGTAGIVIAVVLLVLAQTSTQVVAQAGANSAADNATKSATLGVSTVATWLPTAAVAAVGGVILLIVGAFFYFGGSGKKGY
jgi:hypothetical protein